jgi:heme/copper-type cytochrome/quinol oxidase subunit 2
MRALRGPWIVAPLAALSLVLLVAWAPAPIGTAGVTHDVKVATFQFGFDPNVIQANLGDEIVIHLTSRDVSHGFYLDGYGIQEKVEAGQTKEIRFIADRAGTYRFRCAVTCGALHPFMIGQLVVAPNVPFAAAGAIVLATGLAGFVWSARRREGSL